MSEILLKRLGLIDYRHGLHWQRESVAAVQQGRSPDLLALLEHHPVYTVGARGGRKNLLAVPATLVARGAQIVDVDRGGDITFHGPGQLVAYPIVDLRARGIGPTDYVRSLERALLVTLDEFGVAGALVRGKPGIWVDGAKIAALGVRVQRGVTSHGVALNVTTDLTWFEAIVPCGLAGSSITSIESISDSAPDMSLVEDAFAKAFSSVFDVSLTPDPEPAGLFSLKSSLNGN